MPCLDEFTCLEIQDISTRKTSKVIWQLFFELPCCIQMNVEVHMGIHAARKFLESCCECQSLPCVSLCVSLWARLVGFLLSLHITRQDPDVQRRLRSGTWPARLSFGLFALVVLGLFQAWS